MSSSPNRAAGGLARAAAMTPEQRSERAQRAANARWTPDPSDWNRQLLDIDARLIKAQARVRTLMQKRHDVLSKIAASAPR